jgi:hypothetical protein
MAYAPPPTFAHGGVNVSAANLNIIRDDLLYLYAAMGDENFVIRAMSGIETLYFVNVWRWLWYQTRTGEPATISGGAGADVTLPESVGAMAAYDLTNVEWLIPGQTYRVTGVMFAAEDKDA